MTPAEEGLILRRLETLEFRPFVFRGVEARRHVASFGWRYDFAVARLRPAPPIPDWALLARERVAGLAGVAPADLAQLLINRYAPGAPIGWHRDRREFGVVAGLSLLAPCRLRLRRATGDGWARWAALLAPRSAYALRGLVRSVWEHSIAPAEALRFSLTFRSLRDEPGAD